MMAPIIYLTGEELRKLFRGGKLKVLLTLSFLIGVIFVLIGERVGLSGNLPVTALELLLAVVLPLFMVSLGSDLMAGEFKDGTIKNALKLPVSREALFIGKILAGWTAGALIVLSVFVPTFIVNIVLKGMSSLSTLGVTMAEVGGAILFCGLLVVLANSVSLWTGSGGVGMVVGIVLWMTMGLVGFFQPQLNRFFLTDFADWLHPLLYRGDFGPSVTALLFMTAYYIMGIITGLLAFQKKEV
ncbi:ABC transporter permease subunit [Paenibacillus woosongensis]|uniref:ABC transporter permease subunit n=1 Tax=Paenibacillus woosongensis TaxID=307580 RepID=A0AA95L256_9BACL|nr:ABC transporter permease subunit [Paenibacillus woosongensis]WHX49062.1 ABC transporter permease subunit [Paenibacillus woosongensis]